jgi:hypothetical protein
MQERTCFTLFLSGPIKTGRLQQRGRSHNLLKSGGLASLGDLFVNRKLRPLFTSRPVVIKSPVLLTHPALGLRRRIIQKGNSMDTRTASPPPYHLPAARLALCAAVAIIFTAWAIQYSFRHHRLMTVPTFDDVCYFNDALDRLEQFDRDGISALVHSLRRNPPHSPYSTALAFMAYGLLGTEKWAPYAANCLPIFALVGFTAMLLARQKPWQSLAGCFLVLMLPYSTLAVIEFRPDYAHGLVAAIAVTLLIMKRSATSTLGSRVGIGALFGVAFLIKPTMSVFTGLSMASALTLEGLHDYFLEGKHRRDILTDAAVLLLSAAAVAAPYYWYNGRHIAEYIYLNHLGKNAEIWAYQGSWSQSLLFYLTGDGHRALLGRPGFLLVGIILVACFEAWHARRWPQIVRGLMLAAMIMLALAVPTFTRNKVPSFAATYCVLVAVAAILALKSFSSSAWLFQSFLGKSAVGIAMAVIALLALFKAPPQLPTWGTRGDQELGSTEATCRDILASVRRYSATPAPRIFVTNEGQFANAGTLQWLARTEGLNFRFFNPPLWRDLTPYRQAMQEADFVLAFQAGQARNSQLPSEQLASKSLALARSLDSLSEIRAFPSCYGTTYYLFARKSVNWASNVKPGP